MSRFAHNRRVFFFEEPVFEGPETYLKSSVCNESGVVVCTPVLPAGLSEQAIAHCQKDLLHAMLRDNQVNDYVAWYYTPMAREFTSGIHPVATVYDCMDELSCFAGAPPAMRLNELALFDEADLVFTGGATLFESKRRQHSSVHLFPSSVDVCHFENARTMEHDPFDQASIPQPRLGYAGVIDERMDLDLLRELASQRPSWQFILLGPVAKINPDSLPRAANIHYLGLKQYSELPAYFSGWQIGILPFALNESTRFISPTKTPEYLAAGLQVISTPIRDVVAPYGDLGLVGIAHNAREFIDIAESFLQQPAEAAFTARVRSFLSQSSWDKTFTKMNGLLQDVIVSNGRQPVQTNTAAFKSIAHV